MTPEHIDAVLPRVPAGIPALTGDLTDPDERAEAIDWLMGLYGAAEDQQGTPPVRRTRPNGGSVTIFVAGFLAGALLMAIGWFRNG